jgi:hypothetical protein
MWRGKAFEKRQQSCRTPCGARNDGQTSCGGSEGAGRAPPLQIRTRGPLYEGSAAQCGEVLVLEDGAGFGDVGVEALDYVVELLFDYAAAEF